jgi:hypothetical protein
MSTWDARIADRLSKESTTSEDDKKLLKSFPHRDFPKSLEKWLLDPTEDFSLAERLLKDVEMICD